MNKLILIGNGFDLAHGLKTGYEDFLVNYFQSIIAIAAGKQNGEYSDELCTVHFGRQVNTENFLNSLKQCTKFVELQFHERLFLLKDEEYHTKRSKLTSNDIIVRMKHPFFYELTGNGNWTNIEQYYFEQLILAFANGKDAIDDIHKIFEIIIKKLSGYLKQINKPVSNAISPGVLTDTMNHLTSLVSKEDNLLFINFNYTHLLERYLKYNFEKTPHQLIYIHGNLANESEIIFGYGDDSNEHYPKLENSLNDSLLQYIKSFNYPAENNYEQIMAFIDADLFEVIVIGHSLGVSDRVLLKTIFEDKNCHKIRLFHRGTVENHKKKCISLSRHFSDKVSMRKKIIAYDKKDVI